MIPITLITFPFVVLTHLLKPTAHATSTFPTKTTTQELTVTTPAHTGTSPSQVATTTGLTTQGIVHTTAPLTQLTSYRTTKPGILII